MTDYPDADESYDDDSNVVKSLRQQVKELERQAREAASQAEQATRRAAFMEAGIDPSDTRTSYFVKGYEGEINAEAIRAEAEKAGFITPKPDVSPAELQEMQQAAAVASGSMPTPVDQTAEFHAELATATSQAQVIEICRKYGYPVFNDIAQ